MLCVIMPSVVMPRVIMVSVVILNVVAYTLGPHYKRGYEKFYFYIDAKRGKTTDLVDFEVNYIFLFAERTQKHLFSFIFT